MLFVAPATSSILLCVIFLPLPPSPVPATQFALYLREVREEKHPACCSFFLAALSPSPIRGTTLPKICNRSCLCLRLPTPLLFSSDAPIPLSRLMTPLPKNPPSERREREWVEGRGGRIFAGWRRRKERQLEAEAAKKYSNGRLRGKGGDYVEGQKEGREKRNASKRGGETAAALSTTTTYTAHTTPSTAHIRSTGRGGLSLGREDVYVRTYDVRTRT